MTCCANLDRTKLIQLLINMAGIYILYFISGIFHESVIKRPYHNWVTNQQEVCPHTMGIIFVTFLFAWLLASIYNLIFIEQRTVIPHKNSIITSCTIVVAEIFSYLAIKKTSYPVVIMFESCSIIPVIMVGVFCSRVRDNNLKLGPKKIITTLIITCGILVFEIFDPQIQERNQKQQIIGFVFLLFHFIAGGFLPDLQAQIKVQYKPQPTEMMCDLNKWCTIINFLVLIVTFQVKPFPIFMYQHTLFTFHLILVSILSALGQFFIYRMIKQFKQHFVPFTITSRKILTVVMSIVFYNHQTNLMQVIGVVVILGTVCFQFLTEISKKQNESQKNSPDVQLHQQNQIEYNAQPDQNRNQAKPESQENDIK